VLIARSAEDGYTPLTHVEALQERVLQLVQETIATPLGTTLKVIRHDQEEEEDDEHGEQDEEEEEEDGSKAKLGKGGAT
jgi:hypothetical protein